MAQVEQGLRVHGEGSRGQSCLASILMPRASTDLAAILARDGTLFAQRPAKPKTAQQGAATQPTAVDADLARLIDAWPSLSGDTRAAIVAMLRDPIAKIM